jgi:arsenate reductase
MSGPAENVLFLCTGNSARSIMAEAMLNDRGCGAFRAYSAGSKPTGAVRPEALQQLQSAGISTEGLRSKSWDEFAAPGAPEMRYVITVCDNASTEPCPLWPSAPITAHWGLPDPAAVKGDADAVRQAFTEAFETLDRRIAYFVSLPFAQLDDASLKLELSKAGSL